MVLGELLRGTDAQVGNLSDKEVTGVSYHSDSVRKGDVFFAIKGQHTDGKIFAAEAAKNGAVACIGEEEANGLQIPFIHTDNARRTLAFAYANYYGNPQEKIKIIGVTGTNGKTSTAYMIKTILSHSGYKTALMGTVKSMIGDSDYSPSLAGTAKDNFETMTTPDPDTLFAALSDMANQGVEYLVMETSSHALALEKLSPLKFEIGIFTNLSREHLDFHGNIENYLLAKAKLFSQCKIGIVNMDDEFAGKIVENAKCKIVGFALEHRSDYTAEQVENHGVYGSSYTLHARNARFRIKTVIPGHFTLYNTLAAASAAREMGIDLLNIQNALFSLNGICGRLQRVRLGIDGGAYSVFIDYAHTPYALENLLQCVRGFRGKGQRIVTVFGCGGDRDREKRPIMGGIAVKMSDFVIITSDNARTEEPRKIIDDILAGVENADNYKVIPNRKAAIEFAIQNAIAGDIILLVGKGHEQYEIDKDGLHAFSETEIAERAAENK